MESFVNWSIRMCEYLALGIAAEINNMPLSECAHRS